MKTILLLLFLLSIINAEEYFYKIVKFVKKNILVPEKLYYIPGDYLHMYKTVDNKKVKIKRPDHTFHCNDCGQCFINDHSGRKPVQLRFELRSGILKAEKQKVQIECRVTNINRYDNCRVMKYL